MNRRRPALVERLELRRLLSATYFVSADPAVVTPAGGSRLATAADVNALDLNGGDRVLFAAGETFAGGLAFDAADAGDPALGPVTIGSFDPTTGLPDPGRRPLLLNTAGSGLVATNVRDFAVENLVFSGGDWTTNPGGDGISVVNTLAGNVKLPNLTLRNLDVSNFGTLVTTPRRGPQTAAGGWGVRVGGATGKSGFADVLIEDVAAHHNERGGVEVYGVFSTSTSAGYANRNVTLRRVNASDNRGVAGYTAKHTGSGIILSDVDGGLVERSVAARNGDLNAAVGGPVGVWAWDANAVTIQHNESHHNRTGSTADGGGFDLDGGVTHSVMQYNYSHDNDGAGYGIYQFSGARPFHHNTVRYNISANDGRKGNYAGIQVWNGGSGVKDVAIYNNTVYVTPSAGATPRGIYFQTPTTNVSVRNNVFQGAGGVRLVDVQGKHTNLLFQGNAYGSGGGAFQIRNMTTTYTSLAAWRTATGQERLNGVATGHAIDAGLAGAGTYPTLDDADLLEGMTSFRLTPDSPPAVRNGGLELAALFGTAAGGRDFFGGPVAEGGWSIGADDLA